MATVSVTSGYNNPTGFVSGETVTPAKLNSLGTPIVAITNIVNADISASAAIADTKLATISTAGKVSNSATTATNANTASAIVARDASGNFSAGTITANLTGTASAIADNIVTAAKIANGSITTEKLSAAQQIATAWVSVDGDTANIVTSGTTFTKVSDTVVRVSRTAHGVANGDFVCFDGLAAPNNYLNGTWLVSNATANTFDFTISGATVPSGTLTAQIIRPTRIKRQYNVSKVGRLSDGNYRIFFTNTFVTTDYIVVGSALFLGDPRMGVGPVAQTTTYCDVRTSYYNGTEYNVDPLNVIAFGGM